MRKFSSPITRKSNKWTGAHLFTLLRSITPYEHRTGNAFGQLRWDLKRGDSLIMTIRADFRNKQRYYIHSDSGLRNENNLCIAARVLRLLRWRLLDLMLSPLVSTRLEHTCDQKLPLPRKETDPPRIEYDKAAWLYNFPLVKINLASIPVSFSFFCRVQHTPLYVPDVIGDENPRTGHREAARDPGPSLSFSHHSPR